MSDDDTFTRGEISRAVRQATFPRLHPAGFVPLPELCHLNAHTIVRVIFEHALAAREEKTRWVTGALYASFHEGSDPNVYRRMDGGWWSYAHRRRILDGDFNASNLQRLVTETEG